MISLSYRKYWSAILPLAKLWKPPGGSERFVSQPKAMANGGGARVIYYHFVHASRIALLMIYPKNGQQDLTVDQRKALKLIVEHWR
ncbi:hypothetical protein SAMN03159391_01561 [Pseudomonas sp. NFACC37-1]|nr:hypothetical protein SAMN03159391_01561 [Pseudomonas sp. NFACC37-1]